MGYAALVQRHYRHVFALCLGLLANVHDAEGFERCVLGAMAEFSDTGKPPADVTWEKVVDLARQMRHH
jgi:hypothetical protein